MDPAFQHEESLLQGVDAETHKAIQIVRLDMPGNDGDLDFAGVEHNRRPHIVRHAWARRSTMLIVAAGDQLYPPADFNRLSL